jgi:ATP-dependent helicase/DNAse subunit B
MKKLKALIAALTLIATGTTAADIPSTPVTALTDAAKNLYAYFLEHLLNGDIPLEPAQNACLYCDYYPVCRFQGEQVKKEPVVMKDISLKAEKEGKK